MLVSALQHKSVIQIYIYTLTSTSVFLKYICIIEVYMCTFDEYSELISLKIDWFDLLALQGTLRSLLQHKSKASILWCSIFFTVQNHTWPMGRTWPWPYMDLFRQCLCFSTLPRFVIAFLPRSKYITISWLQSPSAVFLEPKRRKSATTSTFPPSVCHEVMGPDAMILDLSI